ncbi:MAG: DNA repair protein RadA [Methylacidiphilales bacterium]|nr:DNA repair protein RadA [Candidatus Methylacidiphilales bacterium]
MAKKTKPQFVCQDCGSAFPQWLGQCTHCGAWNSIQTATSELTQPYSVVSLSQVDHAPKPRYDSRHSEFDRVVGGGLMPASVTLIGGDPGIGKSTLLLSIANGLAIDKKSMYASGEESLEQVLSRHSRMKLDNNGLLFISTIDIESVLQEAKERSLDILVIDSIQTVRSASVGSQAGTVSQVRECASQLVRFAKESGCTILIVGHVTKDGVLAGPRVLEHLVDTVLQFEGDDQNQYRILRAIKNRFGTVHEIGVFVMTELGIEDVRNPSELFLGKHSSPMAGSVATAIRTGRRTLLVEIQALVDVSYGEYPKRYGQGIDVSRIPMLIAVLARHSTVALAGHDVFVNAVGGISITDCAIDAAILCALISAFTRTPFPQHMIVCGEVGLLGEIRSVTALSDRIQEAQQHGFTHAAVPAMHVERLSSQSRIKIVGVEKIQDLLTLLQ